MSIERHDEHETAAAGDSSPNAGAHDGRQRTGRRWFRNLVWLVVLLLIGGVSFALHSSRNRPARHAADHPRREAKHTMTPSESEVPLGLPEVNSPADNPTTTEKVALGRRLFFDENLSLDRSISCASCHDPEKGWSNGERIAVGVGGANGARNVPTIMNVAFNRRQFWDGRVRTLESQALGPILNEAEMAMPSRKSLVERIQEDSEYEVLFARAFSDGITADNVGRALAAFERTVLAGNSPYDRFQAGDKQAFYVGKGITGSQALQGFVDIIGLNNFDPFFLQGLHHIS